MGVRTGEIKTWRDREMEFAYTTDPYGSVLKILGSYREMVDGEALACG